MNTCWREMGHDHQKISKQRVWQAPFGVPRKIWWDLYQKWSSPLEWHMKSFGGWSFTVLPESCRWLWQTRTRSRRSEREVRDFTWRSTITTSLTPVPPHDINTTALILLPQHVLNCHLSTTPHSKPTTAKSSTLYACQLKDFIDQQQHLPDYDTPASTHFTQISK